MRHILVNRKHPDPMKERHYVTRTNWLRAAVLGANDGIVSISSLIVGIAASGAERNAILFAGLAGLVAGAMSMAAGEYVSVSSQADSERADLEREKQELETDPEFELQELADIYIRRGLDKELALKVARQFHEKDALAAHARDELGISHTIIAKPLQAALTSALTFLAGGSWPLLAASLAPAEHLVAITVLVTILALLVLGIMSAETGGAKILRATSRIVFFGTLAMGVTTIVGILFGAF